MNAKQEVVSNGHLQVIGERGNRRWRAFWWDADDKHSRVLGPAWVRGSSKRTARGATVWHAADGSKPDPSYLTPREAQAELRRLLEHDAARRPTPRTAAGTPVTFADAAEAWLTHGERKRNLKRSTVNDYRQALDTYLLPAADGTSTTPYGRAAFAAKPLRDLRAADVKRWHDGLPYGRTTEKLLMVVRAVCAHARARGWLNDDPTSTVERQPVRYSGDYDYFSREEIAALVRAAASLQDGGIFLTAAMTGLRRGELVALRWRDVDFTGQAIRVRANYSFGELVTPKSGKVRTVPMVPDVAEALARLGQREHFTADEDPVFAGPGGGHLDASALRRRYAAAVKRAELQPLPFTRYATISARSLLTARRSCRSSRGWGTRTSRRPLATCTPRARPATRRFSLMRLRARKAIRSLRARRGEVPGDSATDRGGRLAPRPPARQPRSVRPPDEARQGHDRRPAQQGCPTRNRFQYPSSGRSSEAQAMSEYLVVIEHEGESWGAYCPDLPGVGVVGDTRVEVEQLVREAIAFHLEGLREAGDPIPAPAAVDTTLVDVPAA